MHAVDSCSALGFANSQITVLGGDPAADGESAGVSRQVVLSGTSAEGAARPSVTIHCSRSADPYVLRGRSASETFEYPVIIPGHVETVPEVLVSAVCGRLTETLPSPAACQRGMDQLSRTLQVLEAVPKSIRRRRTIDVYADELTERSVFKTQMTAMGCGVLTWLLLGMIGYLLVGQLFKPPHSLMQILRALWIAPLVMFLLAQLLLPLARGRQSVSSSDTERTTQDNAQDSAADSG